MIEIIIFLTLGAIITGIYLFVMNKKRIRPRVQNLGEMIVNNYESGCQGLFCYVFKNDDNKIIQIWTANGLPFISVYPGSPGMNLPERIFIKNCIEYANFKRGYL